MDFPSTLSLDSLDFAGYSMYSPNFIHSLSMIEVDEYMSDRTTISVSEETLQDFQTVHRFEAENPSESYDETLKSMCLYYFDALKNQNDTQTVEVES